VDDCWSGREIPLQQFGRAKCLQQPLGGEPIALGIKPVLGRNRGLEVLHESKLSVGATGIEE
jgi:hypothetical protein